MSKNEIASLACKILGVFMILQGINVMGNVLPFSMVSNQLSNETETLTDIVTVFIFFIIFGVLLWFFSDKLSLFMVKGEEHADVHLSIKAGDVQRIAFSVLGLFYLGNSLPKLVSSLSSIYSMGQLPGLKIMLLIAVGALTQSIVGLGIFFGSSGLVHLLNTMRTAGTGQEDVYEEEE
jgi:hypothetical protein